MYAAAVHAVQVFGNLVELRGLEPLTFWLQTSGRQVNRGRLRRSAGQSRTIEISSGRCGCCTLLLHSLAFV